MWTGRSTWLAGLGLTIAWLLCVAPAPEALAAAPFPSGPIRLIVPYGPGGASEVAARVAAQGLAQALGQPVVVDNRPGANGAIAVRAAIAAEPDGHTLVLMGASMWAPPPSTQPPAFDPRDLAAVSTLGDVNFGLFVPASLPAQVPGDLLAYARMRPEPLAYGTISLAMDALSKDVARAAGVEMTRVPYKGGPEAMADLVGGRIQIVIGPLGNGLGLAKEGKLRLLATHPHRSPLSPGVSTLADSGVVSARTPTFQMIAVPAKTPRPVVDRLSQAIADVMNQPAVRERFESLGLEPTAASPAATAAMVERAQQAFYEVVRALESAGGRDGPVAPK